MPTKIQARPAAPSTSRDQDFDDDEATVQEREDALRADLEESQSPDKFSEPITRTASRDRRQKQKEWDRKVLLCGVFGVNLKLPRWRMNLGTVFAFLRRIQQKNGRENGHHESGVLQSIDFMVACCCWVIRLWF